MCAHHSGGIATTTFYLNSWCSSVRFISRCGSPAICKQRFVCVHCECQTPPQTWLDEDYLRQGTLIGWNVTTYTPYSLGGLSMLKAALFVLLAVLAAPSAARGRSDCETSYKTALDRLRHMQLPPERLVILSRRALRIYDACQTGDLEGATSFFENLDRWKN